jgi:hypothetical protein
VRISLILIRPLRRRPDAGFHTYTNGGGADRQTRGTHSDSFAGMDIVADEVAGFVGWTPLGEQPDE